MDYTTNYQLPVWAEDDRILMDDFNEAFDTIEDALSQHDSTLDTLETDVAAATTGLAEKGNCQLYLATYIGTGTTSYTMALPGQAAFLMVIGGNMCLWGIRGGSHGAVINTLAGNGSAGVSFSSQSATWSSSYNAQQACNQISLPYAVVALIDR